MLSLKRLGLFMMTVVMVVGVVCAARGQPAKFSNCTYGKAVARALPPTEVAVGTLNGRGLEADSSNTFLTNWLGNTLTLRDSAGRKQRFWYAWERRWPDVLGDISRWSTDPAPLLQVRYEPTCRLAAEVTEYRPPERRIDRPAPQRRRTAWARAVFRR